MRHHDVPCTCLCVRVCVSVSLYTFPLRAPLQPPSPGKPIYYSVLQAFRALLSIRHPSPTPNTMFTTVHHHHLVQSNHLNLCYCSYSLYFIFHLCPNLCPHACTNQCQVVLTLTFPVIIYFRDLCNLLPSLHLEQYMLQAALGLITPCYYAEAMTSDVAGACVIFW